MLLPFVSYQIAFSAPSMQRVDQCVGLAPLCVCGLFFSLVGVILFTFLKSFQTDLMILYICGSCVEVVEGLGGLGVALCLAGGETALAHYRLYL